MSRGVLIGIVTGLILGAVSTALASRLQLAGLEAKVDTIHELVMQLLECCTK